VTEIEVSADIEIAAAPADVAAVMFDPARESEWLQAVKGVELIDSALAPGARVRHIASFMGKEISWTTTVEHGRRVAREDSRRRTDDQARISAGLHGRRTGAFGAAGGSRTAEADYREVKHAPAHA
jgi:hypothetical protein